ncbi:MAG: phosphodiester glycosidase family protein [Chthoniobacterales bacterium]
MRSFNTLLVLLLALASARGEWAVESTQADLSRGGLVEHRRLVLREGEARATVDLAIFSPQEATLRVIDNANGSDSLADAMQRGDCIAGVNGGYFDPADAPIGLMISDGRLVAPQQKARLLGGVVTVLDGRVQIRRSAEFTMDKRLRAARQCGPFLVDGGKAVAGLNDTRAARRTFVATSGKQHALIGFCSAVTLAQLGDLLAAVELAPQTKIQRALNLDGGSSSGFWFAGAHDIFSVRERKTVRDFVAIVALPPRP